MSKDLSEVIKYVLDYMRAVDDGQAVPWDELESAVDRQHPDAGIKDIRGAIWTLANLGWLDYRSNGEVSLPSGERNGQVTTHAELV